MAALTIVRTQPELRERLWKNVRYFHAGLKALGFRVFPDPPESAIMTIPIGSDLAVRQVNRKLHDAGLFTVGIHYPAVSRNCGKLRLSIQATHTRNDLDTALEILDAVWSECEQTGLIGTPREQAEAVLVG